VQNCFKCGSKDFLSKGFGTEQVEIELKDFFPQLKVIRLDYDTTRGKNNFKKIINSFENHEYDVLIGTQMVTKGLDFRNVSLVGVMNLDNSMNFPDFRSHERCFQLVQQVAGRSGRSKERGEVIVQTYNSKSNMITHIINGDYKEFYTNQIKDRQKFNYPPFVKLIKITFKHRDLNKVNNSSSWFFKKVFPYFNNNLLGPEFPYISRIRNKYQKNILLKIPKSQSLSGVKNIIKKSTISMHSISDFRSVQLIVDVDPY
jgi:primosomal protein N' (replication factor Y)